MRDREVFIRRAIIPIFLICLAVTCLPQMASPFTSGDIRYQFHCRVAVGDNPGFAQPDFDDTAWPELKTFLSRQYQTEHISRPGVILWNRIHLRFKPAQKGKDLVVYVQDAQVLDRIYLNGQPLQPCWQARDTEAPFRERTFSIPAELIDVSGENVLALRYYNYYMPKEDVLGRVEIRPASILDRVQIGCVQEPCPNPGTTTANFYIASGLPRRQTVTVQWKVEDYYGALLNQGRKQLVLPPVGAKDAQVQLDVEGKSDRAYKVVIYPVIDGRKGPETWGYLKSAKTRSDYRTVQYLTNDWQFQFAPGVKDLTPDAVQDKWESVTMPHLNVTVNEMKAHRMWYRKKITIPSEMAGKRISLYLYSVTYDAKVFVDGKFVGEKANWNLPGEFDLTKCVTPGRTHDLLIGVTDYIAALDKKNRENAVDGVNAIPERGALADVATLDTHTPWWRSGLDCVPELRSYPKQSSITFVGVESRVDLPKKVKRIKATAKVTNNTGVPHVLTVQYEILLRGKPVKSLPSQVVTIPAHTEQAVSSEENFSQGKPWTPDSPTLYQLRTRLMEGSRTVDGLDSRFGFREFATTKRFFTLNGYELRASGNSSWTPFTRPRQKENLDITRSSVNRHPPYGGVGWGVYGLLDEVGALVQADDFDAWANTQNWYAYEDPRLYKNITEHFKHMIAANYNHPSILLWDWGNEFPFYTSFNRISDEGAKLASQAQAEIQKMDPTRFSVCSSLGDGRGYCRPRIQTLHGGEVQYSNDWQSVPDGLWYFNPDLTPEYEKERLKKVRNSLSYFTELEQSMPSLWRGDKPVFHSELYYVVTEYPDSKGSNTLTGDQIFCVEPTGVPNSPQRRFPISPGSWFANEYGRGNFHRLIQTHMRGLAGSTWVCLRAGEEQLARAAVFPKYWENKFVSGEKTDLPVFVVNNYLRNETVRLKWSLVDESGTTLAGGEKSYGMSPGSIKEHSLSLAFPIVSKAAFCRLIFVVTSNTGGLEQQTSHRFSVFPKADLSRASGNLRVGLYDPSGDTADVLTKAGVRLTRIQSFRDTDLSALQLLIVGANGLDDEVVQSARIIRAATDKGLICAVFRQDKMRDIFPLQIRDKNYGFGSTTSEACLVNRRHPLVRGLIESDFSFWRNPYHDHLVGVNTLTMPTYGNYEMVVSAGGNNGCLVDIPSGNGRYVIYQMPIDRDLGLEPTVTCLLDNLLALAKSRPEGPQRKLYALPGQEDFVKPLFEKQGIDVSTMGNDDPDSGVLFISGEKSASLQADMVEAFVANGGVLWIHDVNDVAADTLKKTFGLSLTTQGNPKQYAILTSGDPLLDGISNYHLTWYQVIADTDQKENSFADVGRAVLDLTDNRNAIALTSPTYLMRVAYGKGLILLDNIRWDVYSSAQSTGLLRQLTRNLGIRPISLGGEKERDYSGMYDFSPIDISPHANRGFTDKVPGDNTGWSGQGPQNDMSCLPTGATLTCLGIPLDVIDPAKNNDFGCIGLSNQPGGKLAQKVTGIKVGTKADALFFFHTGSWGTGPTGADYIRYRVWYEDRKSWIPGAPDPCVDVVARSNLEITDWWTAGMIFRQEWVMPGADLAWSGENKSSRVGFFVQKWENPYPGKVIESIDIESTEQTKQGFVIGITAGTLKKK